MGIPRDESSPVHLTIAAYARAEAEAEVFLPNRLIQCCRPELFATVGYPTRIADDRAIYRFADAMHECRFEKDFAELIGKLTEEEFDLFRRVSEAVTQVTLARSGRQVIPRGSLLRAILVLRHIRILLPRSAGTVVEVGAGSGYLTALLGLVGYRVFSTDVTQAFYLWQSAFWHHLFGDQFRELATQQLGLTDFTEDGSTSVIHVPWWKFFVLESQRIRLAVNVVSANHMLCEMHDDAFLYLVELCRQWFSTGDVHPAALVVEGYGSTLHRSIDNANAALANRGFSHAFGDQLIQIITLGGATTRSGQELAAQTIRGRQVLEQRKTVDLSAVRAYQQSLATEADVYTDDEKFWRYLYGSDHYG
jgi:hypothetical protein